jgi:hypothetical protein
MGLARFLLKHVKQFYPDSFGRVYVINMPITLRWTWAAIRPLLADHARKKVQFIHPVRGTTAACKLSIGPLAAHACRCQTANRPGQPYLGPLAAASIWW